MRINYPRIFKGKVVSLVGGGPSLKGFDFTRLQRPVVAVNDQAFFVDCDLATSIDVKFIQRNAGLIRELKCPFVTNGCYARYPEDLIIATCDKKITLEDEVHRANLSGIFALLVVLTLGARKVLLFGFDGGFNGEDSNSYKSSRQEMISWRYEAQNERYREFKGYDIINIGLGSKIDAFPKKDINGPIHEY